MGIRSSVDDSGRGDCFFSTLYLWTKRARKEKDEGANGLVILLPSHMVRNLEIQRPELENVKEIVLRER